MTINSLMNRLAFNDLMKNISIDQVIYYTIDFMSILGCPEMFTDKTEILHLTDYRAKLPCDYFSIIQARLLKKDNPCLLYSTDTFLKSPFKRSNDKSLEYRIQGSVIYTSFTDEDIEISYKAILTDDNGYPLLPEDSSFVRALEFYIKKNYYTNLYDVEKINERILENAKRDYSWAVAQCKTNYKTPTVDQLEALANGWKTMLVRDNEHIVGFKNTNKKEQVRIH